MASTVKNSCHTCLLLDMFISFHLQSRPPNQGRVKIFIPGGSSYSLRQLIESSRNMSTGQFDLNNHLSRFSSWMFQGCVKLAIKLTFIPLVHNPPLPWSPPSTSLSYTCTFSVSFIFYFFNLQYLSVCVWICVIYTVWDGRKMLFSFQIKKKNA